MKKTTKMKVGACLIAVLWIGFLLVCATGCAMTPDTIYTPSEVDTPVSVPCKPPAVPKPQDMLAALPATATLTTGLKTALAQHDYDIGYEGQLEAALMACQ